MTIQDTRTLTLLLERAQAERDAALAACLRLEEQAARQRAQAVQLQGYRGEYEQRWRAEFARQGQPEIVGCYRSFMTRLDAAVEQQAGRVAQGDGAAAAARDALRDLERRVAAVRKLVERRQAEQQLVQARREQRQSDEAAQRAGALARLALG